MTIIEVGQLAIAISSLIACGLAITAFIHAEINNEVLKDLMVSVHKTEKTVDNIKDLLEKKPND